MFCPELTIGLLAKLIEVKLYEDVELELKAEKENAEIRVTDPTKFQGFVDAEWNIIYNNFLIDSLS